MTTNPNLHGHRSCPGLPRVLRLSVGHDAAAPPPPPRVITCTVTVINTGARAGDEVITVYVAPNATAVASARATRALGVSPRADPLASRLLVAFDRVTVPAGGRVDVHFNFSPPAVFGFVDDDGARSVRPGSYALRFSRGAGDDVDVPVDITVDGGELVVVRPAYPVWW